MALARHKLDYSGEDGSMHEQIMKILYCKLVGGPFRGTIGRHWEEIGFQGSDPRTDIRGGGILGVLQLISLAETYPFTSSLLLEYSNQPLTGDIKTSKSFPLSVKCFEFTVLLLRLLREGRLFPLCNREGSVLTVIFNLFNAVVIFFADIYIKHAYNITHMHTVGAIIENQMRRDL